MKNQFEKFSSDGCIGRVVDYLVRLSYWQLILIGVTAAVVFSEVIVVSIDFLWDDRINAELVFTGFIAPLLDSLVVLVFFTAIIARLKDMRRKMEEEIVRHKNTEDILRQSEEERYRALEKSKEEWERTFNSMSDPVMILDTAHKIVKANKAMADKLGVTTSGAVGLTCYEHVHGTSAPPSFCPHSCLCSDGDEHSAEVYEERLGGYFIVTVTPLHDIQGNLTGSVHTAKDVTERKRAEKALRESEQFLQTVIESEPECIKLLAADGALLQMNRAGLAMIEADALDQVKGQCIYPLVAPEYREAFRSLTEDIFMGKSGMLEFEAIGLRGRHVWLETHAVPLRNEKDEIIALLGITRDITERKQADEKILRSLAEKEVLLKEIHHRVKNNLQVISSLLMLQSRHINDDKARIILEESKNRIKSMSLIHEKLYGAQDLSHIDFGEYVGSLVRDITRVYNRPDLAFSINMPGIFLDINIGIPCGLIINELVSNCLKHAFPDKREGSICIVLKKGPTGLFVLTVKDDGIGFPSDIDFRNASSLGLQLVNTLVTQINGTVELYSEEGTEFSMTFPVFTKNGG